MSAAICATSPTAFLIGAMTPWNSTMSDLVPDSWPPLRTSGVDALLTAIRAAVLGASGTVDEAQVLGCLEVVKLEVFHSMEQEDEPGQSGN